MTSVPDTVADPGPEDVPETFDAYVVRQQGDTGTAGLEQLRIGDLPPGEVMVRVEWSSVNYKDGMVSVPGNRVARASPLVPGVDLAGVVVSSTHPALPAGVEVLAHGGDIGVARHGGFARFARLPAAAVMALPAGLTARQAMVIGTAGFTAALSIDDLERHGLEPGHGPVIVTGASGGVGSLAVALLAARGYEVVASTGKVDQHPWLRGLGATRVIGRDDLDESPGRVLGPELWSGAVDCVGGATLARILRTLRYGAAVAASGLTGGAALATTVYPFITRNVALLGVDSVATAPARRQSVWARLGDDLRPPDFEALVAAEISFRDVARALEDILGARVRGRIVVRVGGG
ncbi:MAG: acrylyl-CoA reductase family protein [Acidimicrobiales bacterium]